MADHPEAAGHVVEDPGYVRAHLAHLSATRATTPIGIMAHVGARQVAGQLPPGLARRLRLPDLFRRPFGASGNLGRRFGLQVLQDQFQLFDLGREPLRRAPEGHPPQTRQLHLQLLDLQRLALRNLPGRGPLGVPGCQFDALGGDQRMQGLDITGKFGKDLRHAWNIAGNQTTNH